MNSMTCPSTSSTAWPSSRRMSRDVVMVSTPSSGAHHLARQRPGALAVLHDDLAVDDGRLDPDRHGAEALDAEHDVAVGLARADIDLDGVEDEHVAGQAHVQQPAVVEAEDRGGQRGHPPDRLLQAP